MTHPRWCAYRRRAPPGQARLVMWHAIQNPVPGPIVIGMPGTCISFSCPPGVSVALCTACHVARSADEPVLSAPVRSPGIMATGALAAAVPACAMGAGRFEAGADVVSAVGAGAAAELAPAVGDTAEGAAARSRSSNAPTSAGPKMVPAGRNDPVPPSSRLTQTKTCNLLFSAA